MATYEPSWASLRNHITPKWLRDDKFGIYTHWGIYSVPACGPNGTWYPHNIYRSGNNQAEHHEKTYGPVSEFGYKDFIPMFKAEKFDADEWAEIFKSSGARFAGPVAEHHDGFSMWDSKVNEWNSAKMGPMRDITGEYLLLNVGPKADGSIPDGAKKCLEGMGAWLKINGEAVFETMPWVSYGEGPTEMESAGTFSEHHEVEYTADDIRFTCRGNLLYATFLGMPEEKAIIRFDQDRTSSFKSIKRLYPGEIESVRMLGIDKELNWSMTREGLEVEVPNEKPCDNAYVFKITRKDPF